MHGDLRAEFSQPSPIQAGRPSTDPRVVRQVLDKHYNLDELEILCFDLGIPRDDLAQLKGLLIIDLIKYCQRHNKFEALVQAIDDEFWPSAV